MVDRFYMSDGVFYSLAAAHHPSEMEIVSTPATDPVQAVAPFTMRAVGTAWPYSKVVVTLRFDRAQARALRDFLSGLLEDG